MRVVQLRRLEHLSLRNLLRYAPPLLLVSVSALIAPWHLSIPWIDESISCFGRSISRAE